jgi:hypothetical protein
MLVKDSFNITGTDNGQGVTGEVDQESLLVKAPIDQIYSEVECNPVVYYPLPKAQNMPERVAEGIEKLGGTRPNLKVYLRRYPKVWRRDYPQDFYNSNPEEKLKDPVGYKQAQIQANRKEKETQFGDDDIGAGGIGRKDRPARKMVTKMASTRRKQGTMNPSTRSAGSSKGKKVEQAMSADRQPYLRGQSMGTMFQENTAPHHQSSSAFHSMGMASPYVRMSSQQSAFGSGPMNTTTRHQSSSALGSMGMASPHVRMPSQQSAFGSGSMDMTSRLDMMRRQQLSSRYRSMDDYPAANIGQQITPESDRQMNQRNRGMSNVQAMTMTGLPMGTHSEVMPYQQLVSNSQLGYADQGVPGRQVIFNPSQQMGVPYGGMIIQHGTLGINQPTAHHLGVMPIQVWNSYSMENPNIDPNIPSVYHSAGHTSQQSQGLAAPFQVNGSHLYQMTGDLSRDGNFDATGRYFTQ